MTIVRKFIIISASWLLAVAATLLFLPASYAAVEPGAAAPKAAETIVNSVEASARHDCHRSATTRQAPGHDCRSWLTTDVLAPRIKRHRREPVGSNAPFVWVVHDQSQRNRSGSAHVNMAKKAAVPRAPFWSVHAKTMSLLN